VTKAKGNFATWLFFLAIAFSVAAIALTATTLILAITRGVGDFQKAAIGPAVALIGSCLATFTSAYVVNLQKQVSQDLAVLTAQSSQQLERLKVELDSRKIAYRELCSAAAVYYYSLRSSARNKWNAKTVEKAESGMINAAHYLLYVDDELADTWKGFWQQAQYIFREAREDRSGRRKEEILKEKMLEKIGTDKKLNLRELHLALENRAKTVLNPPAPSSLSTVKV
jgi:hypothetical protein